MTPPPERWDLEVDLVCVGSGLGGICAAITGHDLGAEVVVLEKAPKLGGVSAYGGGEVFAPNSHKMRELGIGCSGRIRTRIGNGEMYAGERQQSNQPAWSERDCRFLHDVSS